MDSRDEEVYVYINDFLMCLSMAGCGCAESCSKPKEPEPNPVPKPVISEPVMGWEDVLREYIKKTKLEPNTNAVLYVDGNSIIEAQIIEGEKITIPQKTGYNFKEGTTGGKEKYIDSTGKFIKKYNGNNILLLKACYEPIEFEVRFF